MDIGWIPLIVLGAMAFAAIVHKAVKEIRIDLARPKRGYLANYSVLLGTAVSGALKHSRGGRRLAKELTDAAEEDAYKAMVEVVAMEVRSGHLTIYGQRCDSIVQEAIPRDFWTGASLKGITSDTSPWFVVAEAMEGAHQHLPGRYSGLYVRAADFEKLWPRSRT